MAAAILTLLFPIAATAGNQGFTRRVTFPAAPGPNLHWISIPWRYQPVDVGTPGVLDAEDLCQDLGGEETVEAVLRWDEGSSTFVEHLCGTPAPFALSEGTGYAVRNAPGAAIRGVIAGAHDDAFAYSLPSGAGGNLHFLSVPYHVHIPENMGDPRVDAEDLCRQIGAGEVIAILRWVKEASSYDAYACGSELEAPFEIERGVAYGFVNRAGQTIDWQPVHY